MTFLWFYSLTPDVTRGESFLCIHNLAVFFKDKHSRLAVPAQAVSLGCLLWGKVCAPWPWRVSVGSGAAAPRCSQKQVRMGKTCWLKTPAGSQRVQGPSDQGTAMFNATQTAVAHYHRQCLLWGLLKLSSKTKRTEVKISIPSLTNPSLRADKQIQ